MLVDCRTILLESIDDVTIHLKLCLQNFSANTEVVPLIDDAYYAIMRTGASLSDIANGVSMVLSVVATLCKQDWLHYDRREIKRERRRVLSLLRQKEEVMEEDETEREERWATLSLLSSPCETDIRHTTRPDINHVKGDRGQQIVLHHAEKYRESLCRIKQKYKVIEVSTSRNRRATSSSSDETGKSELKPVHLCDENAFLEEKIRCIQSTFDHFKTQGL